MIAPDHGLIWRSHPGKIIEAYDVWSKQQATNKAVIIYDTMWQSTEKMAFAIAEGLAQEGVDVKMLNLKLNHRSDVMMEILDAKAIILGSPTLNNGILPPMADLLCYMKGLRPAGKMGFAFGSYGWSGEAVKVMTEALEAMKVRILDSGMKVKFAPTHDDFVKCAELGRKTALEMKGQA
jgi:flavorubredoxin